VKILFMGTPAFAATVLDALVKNGENIAGVVSQPDKPKNRGMQFQKTPVKACAEGFGIPVYQPQSLKDNAVLPLLKELLPDIIIVVAYGRILPSYILNYPKYRCVNIHASLLPKYRGAAPIQWSILNGEKVTGVTTMYMEEGLDTGDMILKKEVLISPEDTASSLHDKLARLGSEVVIETLRQIENGTAAAVKQNESEASYAPMLAKAMGDVDWNDNAENIVNKVRGLFPWPCAYTHIREHRFKILSAHVFDGKNGNDPGLIDEAGKQIVVQTKSGRVAITELQFDGKRKMSAQEYLRGNRDTIKPGDKLFRH
jgi:methionyl-tRNA formyltransferase